MEAGLPLFSVFFTVLQRKGLSSVGLDPEAAQVAEGREERQRSCIQDSEKGKTHKKEMFVSLPHTLSGFSPLCRSYQTLLVSLLVFSHYRVRFTTEKQVTQTLMEKCV